jgi:hypothetical protein
MHMSAPHMHPRHTCTCQLHTCTRATHAHVSSTHAPAPHMRMLAPLIYRAVPAPHTVSSHHSLICRYPRLDHGPVRVSTAMESGSGASTTPPPAPGAAVDCGATSTRSLNHACMPRASPTLCARQGHRHRKACRDSATAYMPHLSTQRPELLDSLRAVEDVMHILHRHSAPLRR